MASEMRKYINLFEQRDSEVEYTIEPGKVVAQLRSRQSESYTKLAKKVERINSLTEELKQLRSEVKQETREQLAGLFDAEDAVNTRVVETLSFIFTLSKDPKPTVTPKYKDILTELEKQLTPELITVLEGLKKNMVTVTQKEPSLKISPIEENAMPADAKIANFVDSWAQSYDRKLDRLQDMI